MKTQERNKEAIKRLPGQGIRDEIQRRLERDIADPLMIAGFGFIVFTMECIHVWGKIAPSIWIGFIWLFSTMIYAVHRITKGRKKLRDLKRGEEGERIVASYIERDLLPHGYAAFHDILLSEGGKTFNIDHLLIGPNGVFAIETKNYRKPARGEAKVTYDGRHVFWNHRKRGDEARQAQAVASAACEYIASLTGKRVFVQPVLCAVGWYASSTDLYGHRVLLVMEKTLGSVIPKVPGHSLEESDRQMLAARLRQASVP